MAPTTTESPLASMHRKILYLINPIAGNGKKEQLTRRITSVTNGKHIPYTIRLTPPDGNYSPVVKEAAADGYSDICICGGDGTVNEVINAFAHLPVCFSILPAGSGNGLAYTAGIPKRIDKALELLFTGAPATTDAFRVNGRFGCMLAGLGLDAQVAADFATQHTRGWLTYVRLTWAAFRKARAYPFELSTGSTSWTVQAMMITISNSNQFGNQITIAPQASLNDGKLDVVIIKKMTKAHLLSSILHQLRWGRAQEEASIQEKKVMYFQTSRLTIRNTGHAPLHIDGDPCPAPVEIDIEILPGHFKLIHGNQAGNLKAGKE